MKRTTTKTAFTLVELLVVVAIIAMLVGILLPAVQAARSAARRTECSNNLRQIGIAMAGHHAQFNHFPPGSNVPERGQGLSWRVHLLPFLELTSIYDDIDPRSGPSGKSWTHARTELSVFTCPSHSTPQRNRANYAGIMGAGRSDGVIRTEDQDTCGSVFVDGMLYPDSRVTMAHVKDGLSHTFSVAERVYATRQSWMAGSAWTGSPRKRSCVYSAKNVTWPINSQGRVGYFVGDTTVQADQRKVLLNDLMFGSDHSGGAFFLTAEGSVQFVDDTIDFTTYQDLVTIDGREVVNVDW